jgi:hypothetical protein
MMPPSFKREQADEARTVPLSKQYWCRSDYTGSNSPVARLAGSFVLKTEKKLS